MPIYIRRIIFFALVALIIGLGLIKVEAALSASGQDLASSSLDGLDVISSPIWLDFDPGLKCPNHIYYTPGVGEFPEPSEQRIEEFVRNVSLMPDCLWDTTKRSAEWSSREALGYSWGTVLEVSLGGSAIYGHEFMAIRYGQNQIMLGFLKFKGVGAGINLSGASQTQAAIIGECPNGIFSYLGWFATVSAGTLSSNRETDGALTFIPTTRCDSISATRGTTAPIIGVSKTLYEQLGTFVLAEGPRVDEFISDLEAVNRRRVRNNDSGKWWKTPLPHIFY